MKLSAKNDPVGCALLDYMNGKTGAEVIVRTDITPKSVLSAAYLNRKYSELPEIERKALEMCKGKILDVGAAGGVHALYLQEKGLEVTAIDISPGAVVFMKERGIKNVKNADFFELEKEQFDTILMMMNGIGIAGDLEGLKQLLQKAKGMLSADGQLLVDSSDIMYMYTEDDGAVNYPMKKNYYGEVNYRMEYKNITGPPFKWLFVDPVTLKKYARQAGMNLEEVIYGNHFDYLARLTR